MLRVRPASQGPASAAELPWSRIHIGALGSTRLPLYMALQQPGSSGSVHAKNGVASDGWTVESSGHAEDCPSIRESEGLGSPGSAIAPVDVCASFLSCTTHAPQAPRAGDEPHGHVQALATSEVRTVNADHEQAQQFLRVV